MTELVLGIDPSLSSTGWAFIELDSGLFVEFGRVETSIDPHADETESTARRSTIANALAEIYRSRGQVNVAMENNIHGPNAETTIALARLSAVILDRLIATPVEMVHLATAKATAKRVTGGTWKGNAKKEHMVAAAARQWGIEVQNDIADALWVAETARLLLLQHEADGKFD